MSGWVAGATVVGAGIGAAASKSAAGDAADASREAARTAASSEREALEYLKEREQVPQQIREEALRGLQGFYEVPDQPLGQEALIDQARSSPLYDAILGQREAGEQAILRNASATGGLRSGASNAALTDYNMQLENQALLQAFQQAQQRNDQQRSMNLQGLSGLAQLPSNAGAIAQQTANIGRTQAMGMTAAAQAEQQGTQNMWGNILGAGQLGLQAWGMQNQTQNQGQGAGADAGTGGWFSDCRLKENIEFTGKRGDHNWYQWDWKADAAELGLTGKGEGVMAHEVYETTPEAVGMRDGFITVDYDALGIMES